MLLLLVKMLPVLHEWNNENIPEGEERRISLKRELSPEERLKYDEILNLLEDYKNNNQSQN